MTQNNVFRDAFIAHARSALARADALGKQGHAGLRGSLREILAADLLQRVLPPEVKIGGGQLVTHQGELSKQTDIILYSPSIIIPALFNESQGYFAIESCIYAIEIKSTLTQDGLVAAYESAIVTRKMAMLPTEHWTRTVNPHLNLLVTGTANPISALFAFATDLQGEPAAEIARYRAIDPKADTEPAIGAIVVRGRGYWYFFNSWRFVPASEDLREILGLLAGIVNSIPQLLVLKGRPKVGNYLAADHGSHTSA